MRIDLKRWLMILMVPALQGGAEASELSPPEIYRRVVSSTLAVRVTTQTGERFVGAAFVAFRPDRAITALHLIRDAAEIQGTYSDGTPAHIEEIIARDELHDLALLRISNSDRTPLPINVETPPIASRLYAFGSPRGYAFSISDGLLSQVQTIDGFPQYQLTCPFSPGNSGGPVVNAVGEVVGVSAWSKVGAQNLNFAIPSRFFTGLVSPNSAEQSAPQKNPDPDSLSSAANLRAEESVPTPEIQFEQFQKILESLGGNEVRITVSSGNGTQTFICRVPAPTPPEPQPAAEKIDALASVNVGR